MRKKDQLQILVTFLVIVLMLNLVGSTSLVSAAGTCGTGTWTSGNLEIHHINIGQGDSAFIVGPTGKTLLLDAGETNWNSSAKANIIGPYIQSITGCTSLDYVVISHFHVDHVGYVGYGGLWHLVESQGFTVGATLIRDYNTYLGSTSGTINNWITYLAGSGLAKLNPVTAVEGTSQVDLGAGVTFNIVTLDGNGVIFAGDFSGDASPPSENDYSIGAVLSFGAFDEWFGGDLDGEYAPGGFGYTYHDIELSVAPEVGDVDVYKANHHGSSHSSSTTFVNQLDPEVSIISVGDSNTFGHPTQQTMDRLLATSTVYLTQRGELSTNIGAGIVAGNIVIKTSDGTNYTVNGTPYVATEPTRTDVDADGYFAEVDPNDSDGNVLPLPNGGCSNNYQSCLTTCEVSNGEVLISEVFPNGTPEWVELYNTTSSAINISYCVVDDIAGGSPEYHIPAGTFIPAHSFWTLDRTTYFNNAGDEVRFLNDDLTTILDIYSYGNTGSGVSWYRLPDGGSWQVSPASNTTKGYTNTFPFYPIVSSIVLAGSTPTDAQSVAFSLEFSKSVNGVDAGDFSLNTTGGISGASVTSITGSGTTYTIIVNTGTGNGTIRLDLVDNDSIKDTSNNPLGGVGNGNGNFDSGETYTISKPPTLPTNWVGGVSVTSDKNVVAVGRPHIGSEIMNYDGFTSGSLVAYIPMLFKDAFGGSYDSALYLQNVHASNSASVSIKFYDNNGNLNCTIADTIASLASKGYWLPSVTCDSGSLSVGWVGGVKVESNQPIVAVGRPHIGSQVMTYNGFASGTTTSYIPMLFKGAFGGSYNAAFYVQNVHVSNTANVTINYYDSNGVLNCTKADTIAALASKGYWIPGATCDSGSLPAGWVGGVVVASDQPIVTVGRPHIGSQIATYTGFDGGGSTSYMPMLFKGAFGGSYNAAFYLQNVHETDTANVNIQFYDNDGNLNCTKVDNIEALASKGYWLPSVTCDSGTLPTGWVGGVVVTSDRLIVGVGRPHIGTQVLTYNGFTGGSQDAYLPMLFKGAFGGTYNSALYLQNTEASAAFVTLKFYDTNGNLSCIRTDNIQANATLGLWLPSMVCDP